MASKSTMSTEIMKADVKTNIGLSDDSRKGVVEILNARLCDEYTLYTKTRKYHWNVTGPHFSELHKLFEAQYEALDEAVDSVAERARALGGKAFGTLAEFSENTSLEEAPGKNPDAEGMIKDLLEDYETLINNLRRDLVLCVEKYGDAGTSDFLTGLMEEHEKTAWMLRSFLEK